MSSFNKMKLSVIIPILNRFDIAKTSIDFLSQEKPAPYEIIVIDNGSDTEFKSEVDGVSVVRLDEAIGSYPAFKEALNLTGADILAFFHSDFFVYDKDWYKKVLKEFEKDDKLGLIGFIGSNEIDSSGGRGSGTVSNFMI